MLNIQNLQCIRGDRELFTELSFSLNDGEIMQVHGANGSGKTTLLRILAGLTAVEHGDIYWDKQLVEENAAGYFENLRFLGHLAGIKLELTPLENLRFFASLYAPPLAMTLQDALDKVELYGFENEPARTLSAGQRRRITLARLLISPGRLWLLDEPHTSLDMKGMEILRSILLHQLQRNGMIIIASHTPIDLHETPVQNLQLLT
jgi:heme exporter protein A